MRRLFALAALAAIALAGCGVLRGARPEVTVPVGVLGEPLAAAPLLIDGGSVVRFQPQFGRSAEAAPFLIASGAQLPALLAVGYRAVGALCAEPPDSLLWHRAELFSWQDLKGAPLYVAPGADPSAFETALSRYEDILSPLPKPMPAQGGVAAFAQDGGGFLLAPEPLASALVQRGAALLAQPLPDELGPYPSCLVLAQGAALRRDPLLSLQFVRTLDLGLWQLKASDPAAIAPQLRAIAPTLPLVAIARALAAARLEGIFRDAVALDPSTLSALRGELPGRDLGPGAFDESLAERALDRPFP